MNDLSIPTSQSGEIVLYQPDENVSLEVKLMSDTVWLSIDQMAQLFGRDRSVIGKHVRSVFSEGELTKESVWANFAYTAADGKTYMVDFYNLDMIISVGYRVKSKQGIVFRQWANGVLKEYLLRGYSINQQLLAMQRQVDLRFDEQQERIIQIEAQQQLHRQQIDFFIRTNQPPIEGIFFEGQIFDAYRFVEELIKSARHGIVLIDNYIDASVIEVMGQRGASVKAEIYTETVSVAINHAATLYNAQHPDKKVEVRACTSRFHDRFLIIDDDVYHLGASVKDLGKRLFAFSRLGLDKSLILQQHVAI